MAREDHLRALCAALEETAERPLDRSANRWLGEAQAVATDLRDGDPDVATLRDRLETVEHLCDQVDETGDETADEALATARGHLDALLTDLAGE